MDETLRPSPIKKRLAMQNEVLKWITEFSEKMEKRANEATVEVNGLLDQAGALEVDLKNTFNSFRSLSYTRYIDHRIADDNDVAYHKKKSGNRSVELSIPAQNYETDILPRYKEALSLGLTSCKNYLNTKSRKSVRSFFSTASVHGQLPHIIGSEEYNHDNSCGLTENIALGPHPLDFSSMVEPNGVSSVAAEQDPSDLCSPQMFIMQQDSSKRDGSEPLVSAALDFKAMLEAALLNTYRFYDEETSSIHAVDDARSTGGTKKDMNQEASTSSQTEKEIVYAVEGNLTSRQDADIHVPELFSALASSSLFDAEEDLLPPQEPSLYSSALAGNDTRISEDKFEQKTSLEDVSTLEKGITLESDSS